MTNGEATVSDSMRERRHERPLIEQALELIDTMADQLDLWAGQSQSGGWSTHQVDPMRQKADELRRHSAYWKRQPKP